MSASADTVVQVGDIDAAWLTRVLARAGALPGGARVTRIERQPCGTGQLADSYRFALTYSPAAAGQDTVVAQVASQDPVSRKYGRHSGFCRTEIRADNVLFDAHGGHLPVVILDWQGVGYGYGPIDVAYYLSTSLATEDRRQCERDLVALYHQGLVGQGVDDYSAPPPVPFRRS